MANNKPIDNTVIDDKVDESPETVELKASSNITRKEIERKNLASFYLKEKKVPVTISPFYAPYLGRVVPVLVNGIRVDIPADGRKYQINETHANEIISKIRRI